MADFDNYQLAMWESPDEEGDASHWEDFNNIPAAEERALTVLRGGKFRSLVLYAWNQESNDYDIEIREFDLDDLED